MLIATLPTLVGSQSLEVAANIIAHPCIGAVRYNSGGDSPLEPYEILAQLKHLADQFNKQLYVDLEGRQVRIARWTPSESGSIILNRDFSIELPAQVHVRNAGWFNIANATPSKRKLYLVPKEGFRDYYFGESQSVHVVGKRFDANGYLGGLDAEYIHAAVSLGLNNFMLSFVEDTEDYLEFNEAYNSHIRGNKFPIANVVLKIESMRGVQYIKENSQGDLSKFRLMAARDDLFVSFVGQESKILDALKLIVSKDHNAIVASRILSGLEFRGEITLSDIEDILLMRNFGYKHFMLSDGLAHKFASAIEAWDKIIMPILKKDRKSK